jgi:hypothetical protein
MRDPTPLPVVGGKRGDDGLTAPDTEAGLLRER